MYLLSAADKLFTISRPLAVRLLAIVALISVSLPIVMFSEWKSAKAEKKVVTAGPPPNVEPPQEFKMPADNSHAGLGRSLMEYGERAENYLRGVFVQDEKQISDANVAGNNSQTSTDESAINAVSSPEIPIVDADTPADEIAIESPAERPSTSITQPPGTVDFDYNGDTKSDISRWDPTNKIYQVAYSGGGFSHTFGSASSGAKPAPANYDRSTGSNSAADAAVFDSGTWYIRMSGTSSISTISFGQAGDIPMPGNYIGASTTDDELAFYRPSTGTWYWREVGPTTVYSFGYGNSTDIPVAGDYDGDGDVEPAIYRPSTGNWWISSLGTYNWGIAEDIPVAADYDGDGKTDRAVFRPSSGTWWIYKSSTSSYDAINWGNWADQPVIGDFNGDGKADLSIWRPSSGVWYVDHTNATTFEYHNLGSTGDFAANSAYIKQVGGSISSDALSLARLAPRNATGSTNLYSQNFAWGRNLVSLPGRSGLDLNIGLSYNSLVWTKQGSTVHFDPNYDNVTPGFNLGFATIEQAFYDSTAGKWNYLMVTPSGARVRFRQVGATSVYETVDSSYLQLKMDPEDTPADPPKEIQFDVYGTDGARMSYSWSAGAFRCVKITDRNGNYLSMEYNQFGYLETATDTLQREITVNYDSQYYPTSITQTWRDDNGGGAGTPTHTWATFTYTTTEIETDFVGVTVAGPPNGTYIKVLQKVTYPDTSWTKFNYNEYGQVEKIENYADDDHLLNYTSTDLDSVPVDRDDCPRFTETRVWAENFNVSGGTAQPVIVENDEPTTGSATLDPGSISVSGKFVETRLVGHPDGLHSRTWYASSGLYEDLVLATQDCTGSSCSVVKRWTWNSYQQDDHLAANAVNPRIVESRVGDGTNVKRTTLKYLGANPPLTYAATYGLVEEVKVYGTNLSTVIKQTNITYDLDSKFTSRRIIGLPSVIASSGWDDVAEELKLVSKVSYSYDQGDFSDDGLQQNIDAVQHDTQNYGDTFTYRGNLTSTVRWDANDPEDAGDAITTSTLKYNIAGSIVSKSSPWGTSNTRMVKIGYSDNWNSSGNPTTYAYPTTITDPADNSSTVKYRYDIGANVQAESPAPDENWEFGKRTVRTYDSIGRLQRNSVWWNPTESSWAEHSYVRYEYPSNGVQTQTYAPVVDQDGDGNISEDEVYSESWHDGAGRVRMSRTEHPGSTGGWASSFVEYDILGRVKRQSVPTETNSSYAPAGDDSGGPLWNQFEYDWMGRTTRTIPTDSNGSDGKDTLISYAGCGCAGGLETTVQGPLVPRTDTTGEARRKQKSFADILGRTWKTQTFDWAEDPYLTTEVKFNGRDQVIKTTQTDHSPDDPDPDVVQESLAVFDGHGRLLSSHRPEQRDGSNNPAFTTYTYNLDDSLNVKTDARGATSTMTYNNLGLVTKIESELPSTPYPFRKNYALASSGSTASSSSNFGSGYPPSSAINGQRSGAGWGSGTGGWSDGTSNNFSNDWLQVDFGGEKTIDQVVVATVQNNYSAPVEPDDTLTFTLYGIVDFDIEYWDGDSWEIVSGASVTGNNKVLRALSFSPVTTSKMRVKVHAAADSLSRITEFEAWGPDDTGAPVDTETDFTYDNLGNRLTMTDEMGVANYNYDSLSRLIDETRSFTDTLTHAPLSGNSFKLEYTYNLSGSLKSITDPYGDEIEYTSDKSGRLNQVTGSTYGGITTYADEATYRAWGGLKSLEYGNGVERATAFNNRLLPSGFDLKKDSTDIMVKAYEYYKDGSLKFVDDQLNAVFDRLQTYDHAGRAKDGKSGAEASGGTVATEDQDTQLPYRQSYEYNAFGNMTQRNNLHWGKDAWQGQSNNLSYTYVNNRVSGWTYDADGRTTISSEGSRGFYSDYDARGLLIRYNTTYSIANTWDQNIVNRFYNGDGREVKRQKTTFAEDINMTDPPYGTWSFDQPTYYIRSSVLGGETVTEVGPTGKKIKTTVFAAGAKIATQSQYTWSSTDHKSVAFHHVDDSGMSHRSTSNSGLEMGGDGQFDGGPGETDPMGGNMGLNTPYIELLPPPEPPTGDWGFIPLESDAPMYVNGQQVTCTLDGMAIGCAQGLRGLGTSTDVINTPGASWILSQLGIIGRWVDSDGPITTGPGGHITITTNTTFQVDMLPSFGTTSPWTPQSQPPTVEPTRTRGGPWVSDDPPSAANECWVNVNIRNSAGVTDGALSEMKDELSRIFSEAGVSLSFNGSGEGYAQNVNLWLVSEYPQYIVNELKAIGYQGADLNPRGFQSGRYFGNVYVRADTPGKRGNGIYSARVGGHEIGHTLLMGFESREYGTTDKAPNGIMSYRGYFDLGTPLDELNEEQRGFFRFLPAERDFLKNCKFARQSEHSN